MNKVILLGRLTKDPEIQYVGSSQSAVAKFTLAVDRKYKSKDGSRKTDFIKIEAWNEKAELCSKYLKKGKLISVDGSIEIDSYSTETGENKSMAKVRLSELNFINSGSQNKAPDNQNKHYEGKELFEEHGVFVDIAEEDIPF